MAVCDGDLVNDGCFKGAIELAKKVRCPTLILENCGHAMLSEKPDEVLDSLVDIVRHSESALGGVPGPGRPVAEVDEYRVLNEVLE